MADFLTQEEHAELVREIDAGSSNILVSRSMSRQFFINVGRRNVRDLTGISVILEKIIVLGLLAASIVLLIACLAFVITDFGWGALLAVPLIGIFWTILVGFTGEMGSWTSTIVIYLFVMLFSPLLGQSYGFAIMLFASSLAAYRVSHLAATHFLYRLFNQALAGTRPSQQLAKLTLVLDSREHKQL